MISKYFRVFLGARALPLGHRGATLAELMVGIGFFGVILLVANSFIVDSFKLSARANAQGTIDSLQMAGMHVGRSSRILYDELVKTDDSPLAKCLKRKGTGCGGFAGQLKPFNAKGLEDLNGFFSEAGSRCDVTAATDLCPIQRITKYRIFCSKDSSCEAIELNINTVHKKQSETETFVDRFGTVQIPGLALVSREAIDFSCATSEILSGVDYPTLTALCKDFTGLNASPNKEPLRTFATTPSAPSDWQEMASMTCASYGFKNMGLGKSQPICGTPE